MVDQSVPQSGVDAKGPGAVMYLVDQCSNCGLNVDRELAVVTPISIQHRECAKRFGVGTHGVLASSCPSERPARRSRRPEQLAAAVGT